MSVKLRRLALAVIAFGMTGCGASEKLHMSDTYDTDMNISSSAVSEDIHKFCFAADEETEKNRLETARTMSEEFMNGLVGHDNDTLMQYGGANSFGAYSFLDNVDFNGWEIVDSVVYGSADPYDTNIVTYKIKLDVSSSGCELFPEGESIWELDVNDSDKSYFSSFRREGVPVDNIIDDRVGNLDFSDAVKMSYAFTSEFGWLCRNNESIDNGRMDEPVKKERFVNNLIEFCQYFDETDDMLVDDALYSADWLYESAYKLLGINSLDIASLTYYDQDSNTIKHTESGYCFGYSSLVDEKYDESEGMSTVVLDWYADTIYLSKACTYTYTLKDNGDGTMKIISAEKNYDSGVLPVFFVENINRDG